MSSAARKRGGRARGPGNQASDASSHRTGPQGPTLAAPSAFDGPASRGNPSNTSQGRQASNAPSVGSPPQSPATSPRPAQAGFVSPAASGQTARPMSTAVVSPDNTNVSGDPARDAQRQPHITDSMRNIDLPASFYTLGRPNEYKLPTEFKSRPGYNNTGSAVQVNLNSYPVVKYPTSNVFQYDVQVGNGSEKRVVIRKVWASQTRVGRTGRQILFDNNKLAWGLKDLGSELRFEVDLDAEQARPAGRTSNSFRVVIRRTKVLDISAIQSYLDGRVQMSTTVLESINFLDHLLREHPSTSGKFIPIKRQFFTRNGQRVDLGGGVEVLRGVYQSIRLAEGKRLVVNVDVANCCFWKPNSLLSVIREKYGYRDPQGIIAACRPEQSNGSPRPSDQQRVIGKGLKKLGVKANYAGIPESAKNKEFIIKDLKLENARQYKITMKDGWSGSIEQYFKKQYNISLQYAQLPLVEMTKKDVLYPMELLAIVENQRYPFKLDEKQTANMIKFAVSPPAVREDAIQQCKTSLEWPSDPIMKHFGLQIDPAMIRSNARLLPPPSIQFGGGARREEVQYRGRWDLRGKKFLFPNPQKLVSWGIGYFKNDRRPVDKGAISKFVTDFTKAYRVHGGDVANQPPNIIELPDDPGQAVERLHQSTGNMFKQRPQLMIFLVQDRQAFHYLRIKKSCDCRFGVVSQVMQIAQAMKGNPQYYSNVLMKVNAKLGGTTSQAISHPKSGFDGRFGGPTMLIGADVSHASPGSPSASMAALTVSFDKIGARYAATCQTNGHRVEIISAANWTSMLKPLVAQWMANVGGGRLPQQVYYFRDGVSEGQFLHVKDEEALHIRRIMNELNNEQPWTGKLTIVIASKRHHIRAFPQKGSNAADNKGNPVPGVLVERDCTTPFEWDFYLYSHIALQGTSRPVHYTVIHDEADHKPDRLQNMIYEHCYQYMRSTTSVSLFPAVYYAHLASNRARAHEDVAASEGPRGGPGFKANQPPSSEPPPSESKPLIPLYNVNGISWSMWYI